MQEGLTGSSPGRANGSIRYEFAWPSNGGLQRFAWPLLYVSALRCMLAMLVCPLTTFEPMWLETVVYLSTAHTCCFLQTACM